MYAILSVVYLFCNYELAMCYSKSWLMCEEHLKKIVGDEVISERFLAKMEIIHKQLKDNKKKVYCTLAGLMEWALEKPKKKPKKRVGTEEDNIADARNVGGPKKGAKAKGVPDDDELTKKMLVAYQNQLRLKLVMDAHHEYFHDCLKDRFPGLALRIPRHTQVDFVRKKFEQNPDLLKLDG